VAAGATESHRQNVGGSTDTEVAYASAAEKGSFAGEKLEAAIGVEPMMEVLQLSDGDDGAWPSVRESAAPSKVLRRLGHRQSLSVVDGDEVSRQQHVGR
jgi:hypothetical protein